MWLVLTAQASVVTALSALENGHEGGWAHNNITHA